MGCHPHPLGRRYKHMNIRFAKNSDSRKIAVLHKECVKGLRSNFDKQMGVLYLKKYYKFLINENNSIVLCAEDKNNQLIGVISGTLDYEQHKKLLNKKKFRLLIAALPRIMFKPRLVINILNRQKRYYESISNEKSARITFWAWRREAPSVGGGAIVILQNWLEIARVLGAKYVFGDIDVDNPRVTLIHRSLGASIKTEISRIDGRTRQLIMYNLAKER